MAKKKNIKKDKENEMSKLMKELAKHADAVGIQLVDGEDEAGLQNRLLEAMDDLSDDAWDSIPAATKKWSDNFYEDITAATEEAEEVATDTEEAVAEKAVVSKAKTEAQEKASKTSKSGKEWKEGSKCQMAFEILKKADMKGITMAEAEKEARKAKIDVARDDYEAFLKRRFSECVSRGLATKKETKEGKVLYYITK